MSRRIFVVGLLVLVVWTLVACGSGSVTGSTSSGDGKPADSSATDGPFETGDGTGATDGSRIRFFRQAITDPAAENAEAIVFLIPEGWQYQGSVQWLPAFTRIAFLQTHVADPTTGITIDWLPIQNFMYFEPPAGFEVPLGGNYQGKVFLPPITDPVEFVNQFWIPGTLPELEGATLVTVAQVPAVAQDFATQYGGPADAFAYHMRYEYQQDGQTWEADVDFALLYASANGITSWFVNFAHAAHAPKGVLDANAGVISTIVASRTTTPQWEATYRIVQQLFNQGIQQQMNDTVAFGQALAQHRAEIQALQAQVTAERQASQDRIADLNGQILAGVDTYVDPVNGGFVQLPVGFDDYWVNDRGQYLTAAVGFDPNSLNDGTWQRLQPRDR